MTLFVQFLFFVSGNQEVIEGLPYEPRSDLDRMIAALAQRQYGQENASGEVEQARSEAGAARYLQRPSSIRRLFKKNHSNFPFITNLFLYFRNGDIEGIRQTTGNWQKDSNIKWTKNNLLQPLSFSELQQAKDLV